ncbi:unnamed protein product [Cyprideis torosa]|uniref:Dolichol-phosphate mannosyltransferase subunit 1 n=1 Tax=Cyprideis torosa TaxID=163714 RepID=A0A7R8ZQ03_9CRUS|nr:unnamed protein product [Cyprideis torosa]CAG0900190.1 unnamed protein product [Cyprideis torosa]
MKSKNLVIVPTYNEIGNIEEMVDVVMGLDTPFDLLVVDDNSPDGTSDKVVELQLKYPDKLHLIKREGKLGLGTAYIKGFRWGIDNKYDIISEMDCDFSHNPQDLIRLAATIDEGSDVAVGSRYIDGGGLINWPKSRIFLSKGASLYAKLLTGLPVNDTTAGFVAYRRHVLESINLDLIKFKGYSFQIQMKLACHLLGFKITEIPITFKDRVKGVSKLSGDIITEAIMGEQLESIKTSEELFEMLKAKTKIDHNPEISKVLYNYQYEKELLELQGEMVNLQKWISENNKKVVVIFEGRDAAGKGGAIKRFREHLNPRSMRTVALNKPTEIEIGQWYFRRYIQNLPNIGEIVFFDRSWYNRAVVEPIMGFCTPNQYERFMAQVSEFEHMLYEDDVYIIKFWFSISKDEQLYRFQSRLNNPLKKWKYSPVDEKGQEYWDQYTYYKDQMFSRTHTSFSPWIVVKANDKKKARLESIRYVLSYFDYPEKKQTSVNISPDPNIVSRYFRLNNQLD